MMELHKLNQVAKYAENGFSVSEWFRPPRAYFVLFVLTLAFRLVTALPLDQAGYMDASYALHVAENLAQGRGLTENVLWNYLDNPAGLPHPSNLYWMPLPSLLIAPFYVLFGVSYRVAQIPFIFLSSLLPLFAFFLSYKVFSRNDYAWTAGIFTAFSGFYTIYWVSPDNFAPFALTASLCLFSVARGLETEGIGNFVVAGILAALSHLSRADGLLLLAVVPLALFVRRPSTASRFVLFCVVFFIGYLALMLPWFVRDYVAVGAPYPSAGAKTLWLTNYDELFRFADDLTPGRYLAQGIGPIIISKLAAGGLDILIVLFGALQLFLAPFALVGLWRNRKHVQFSPFFIYAALLFLAMALLFTFPSTHGSMLHSSTALLPYLAIGVAPGLDATVEWIARRRKSWQVKQAAPFFRVGFMALAVFLSFYLYAQGVFPVFSAPSTIPLWDQRDLAYHQAAAWLDQSARPDDAVMVVDPPSFYNVSHRRAFAIPTDSLTAISAAAARYSIRYLILEYDHPRPLNDLFLQRATVPALSHVADFRDALNRPVTLYEVTP